MYFNLLEAIATFVKISVSICDRPCLERYHGKGKWRKLKGITQVRLPNNTIRLAEIHWYEAHGIASLNQL
jgi:hypothetical protein